MKLRRATASDVAAITAVVRAAYAPWVPVMGCEPMPMRFDYAKAVDEDLVDIHEVDDMLAGLVQMRPASDHLMLINIAVAPVHQGRGLGRLLMAYVEEIALARRLGDVRLVTDKLMTSNQRLYERLGYIADREEPYQGGAIVHMSKRLASAS